MEQITRRQFVVTYSMAMGGLIAAGAIPMEMMFPKEAHDLAQSYFNPVLTAAPGIIPRGMQAFAGRLEYDKMNIMFRMIMKSQMKKKGIPEGDFRDFEKIKSWAQETAWPLLSPLA